MRKFTIHSYKKKNFSKKVYGSFYLNQNGKNLGEQTVFKEIVIWLSHKYGYYYEHVIYISVKFAHVWLFGTSQTCTLELDTCDL